MTSLHLDSVNFHYDPAQPILRSLGLELSAGELLCILGKSGSGKSTLLHLVAGLLHPTSGDILEGDQSLLGVPAYKRKIVLLSQKALLFPFTSVEGNIAFSPRLRGVPKRDRQRRVTELLELVDLAGFEKRMPSSLSGGEAQRVALARALAADPTTLLMDEPFSNLDAPIRSELQRTFRRLHDAQKLTTIFVTHQLMEAMSIGDRVAALVRGTVDAVGFPSDMYQRPPTTGAAHLVGIEHWLKGKWVGNVLRGDWGTVEVEKSPTKSDAVLAARPEHLSVSRKNEGFRAGSASELDGIVVEQTYRGEYLSLLVELAGGSLLQARATISTRAGKSVSVGDDVVVLSEPGCWFPIQKSEAG